MTTTRLEHDLPGDREVPAGRYFGIQTLRAVENFAITGITIAHYPRLIKSLAYIKKAAALTNQELGLLDPGLAEAICRACPLRIVTNIRPQFDAILVCQRDELLQPGKTILPADRFVIAPAETAAHGIGLQLVHQGEVHRDVLEVILLS
jgi:hypothetical protein